MCSQPWPEYASSLVWQFFLIEDICMSSLENMFLFLDYLTDTQRKRHIIGGVLMSVSLFFGGLAFTMMTVKEGDSNEKLDS